MRKNSLSVNCEETPAGRVHSEKIQNHLSGYDCVTVPEAGWAGEKNGELLSLAENAGFQVFVSLDQGIEFQQI